MFGYLKIFEIDLAELGEMLKKNKNSYYSIITVTNYEKDNCCFGIIAICC